ncbi:NAD(P)-binding protein [Amycolatopsis sp. NPDC006131]|uniref:FAD-dependent oxidoreductase n=1 Tax=Amycolatopsis sp. NPDC006131 TaxID=3156731 RepID=UPI0033A890DC
MIIVGAGLGGLTLARGLHAAGIGVAVYERDPRPFARGQGYRIHLDPEADHLLRDCLPPPVPGDQRTAQRPANSATTRTGRTARPCWRSRASRTGLAPGAR